MKEIIIVLLAIVFISLYQIKNPNKTLKKVLIVLWWAWWIPAIIIGLFVLSKQLLSL